MRQSGLNRASNLLPRNRFRFPRVQVRNAAGDLLVPRSCCDDSAYLERSVRAYGGRASCLVEIHTACANDRSAQASSQFARTLRRRAAAPDTKGALKEVPHPAPKVPNG